MVPVLFGIYPLAPVGISRDGVVLHRLLYLSSLKFTENGGQHALQLRQVLVVQHRLYDDLKQVKATLLYLFEKATVTRGVLEDVLWVPDNVTLDNVTFWIM